MAVHRAPPVDDRALFAEFPFLPGAEALLGEFSTSVGALFSDPTYAAAQGAGRQRILAAVDDPTGTKDLEEAGSLHGEERLIIRFLSFQYARLLVSASTGRAPIRRWAVREAKSFSRRLGRQDDAIVRSVAQKLGYDLEIGATGASFDLADYLRLATPVREADFRLVRQAVSAGRVTVPRDRAVRLLEEGVRIALSEPVALVPGTRSAIEEREREFLSELAIRIPTPTVARGIGPGGVRPEAFPPCIRAMRRTLEQGENLSHSGRFALAAFLHRAGASFEAIVDAYRGAPDFDESITRYQVEHITRKDDGKGYEPSDCSTLRTHNLCYREGDPRATDPRERGPDRLCHEEWLRHPSQYYREKGRGGATPAPASVGEASGTPGPPG